MQKQCVIIDSMISTGLAFNASTPFNTYQQAFIAMMPYAGYCITFNTVSFDRVIVLDTLLPYMYYELLTTTITFDDHNCYVTIMGCSLSSWQQVTHQHYYTPPTEP